MEFRCRPFCRSCPEMTPVSGGWAVSLCQVPVRLSNVVRASPWVASAGSCRESFRSPARALDVTLDANPRGGGVGGALGNARTSGGDG